MIHQSESSGIRLERRGAAAVLTIDRPHAANAFGPAAVAAFRRHLAAVRDDATIAGMIVTGAGTRHFCSGGDVKAYAGFTTTAELDAVFDAAREVLDELEAMPVATVAAINGVAIGGGLELALACDFRVAIASASLSLPQVRMGIMPGWFASERLLAVCGRARAMQIALSGRRFSATEARDLGLVDQVVEVDVVEAAHDFLQQFEGADRQSVAGFKGVVRAYASGGREAGRRLERETFSRLWFRDERKR